MANAISTSFTNSRANPVLTMVNGRPTTTSVEVARFFGKRHDNVLRDIEALRSATPPEFNALNFEAVEYVDAKGESRPTCLLTRDGFTLLAMGFTGKKALQFKLAYIEAFNQMEAKLSAPVCETISLEQQQALKEMAAIVNAATQTSFSEIWSRLHSKFNVPRYTELPKELFNEAYEFLKAPMTGDHLMQLLMRHMGRPRLLTSFDNNGCMVVKALRDDDWVGNHNDLISRIKSGDIPNEAVKQIANASVSKLTGGTLALA